MRAILLFTLSTLLFFVGASRAADTPAPPGPTPEVQALLHQAGKLQAAGDPGGAERLVNQALTRADRAGDLPGTAQAEEALSDLYLEQFRDPQKAIAGYQRALELWKTLGSQSGEAKCLSGLGQACGRAGDPKQAQGCLEKALGLYRGLRDQAGEIDVLIAMSPWYDPKAEPRLHEAVRLSRIAHDRPREVKALQALGVHYVSAFLPARALQSYYAALVLVRDLKQPVTEAEVLFGIANVYSFLGQWNQAVLTAEQARRLLHSMKKLWWEAAALQLLGLGYRYLGRRADALRCFDQEARLGQQSGDSGLEGWALANSARLSRELGEARHAREYGQRIQKLARAPKGNVESAMLAHVLGAFYSEVKQPEQALSALRDGLAQAQLAHSEILQVELLGALGDVLHNLGRHGEAKAAYSKSLTLSEKFAVSLMGNELLGRLAMTEQALGHDRSAEERLRTCISQTESTRSQLGGIQAQSGLFAVRLDLYHRYLALLLEQGRSDEAFELAQRTKARALLDLLQSDRVEVTGTLTQEDRNQEQQLRDHARELNLAMVSEGIGNEVGSRARFHELGRQLAEAEAELSSFTDALAARHPELLTLRAVRTAKLSDAKNFLPPDTAVLEFVSLRTDDRVDLPDPRDKQDGAVLLVLTVVRGQPHVGTYRLPVKFKTLTEQITALRTACSDPRKPMQTVPGGLYRRLLAPATKQLAGKRRLIICPDGPLWDVPFQALWDGKQFLAEKYEIDYAYSATGALAALALRAGKKQTWNTLLALANPAFVVGRFGDNPRHPGQRPIDRPSRPIDTPSRDPLALARDLFVPRGASLLDLPGTQREADGLKRDFPGAAVFTREQAQEAVVKREAGKYRYLHFATHGFFNDAAPMLSSIVLAQPPKDSPEDGFLTARELFDLKLNAELVVLSACNTARGEKRSGEGIVGLTWALFAAGAPTQVVSQWSVDDQSTALLMERFYRGIKAGKPKGAALRAAELSLLKDPKYRHPYYWAPFILMGDWR